MSNISVIMVSYHTGAALWLAIEAVLEQPECRELILVDNGNVPGVMKRLGEIAAAEPRFQLITGHGNIGFSKGCNLGAKVANGEYLLLLNPDSMLPQGGLARALEAIRPFGENTLAGCYLINPDGTEQRACRRSILTPKNAAVEGLGIQIFFDKSEALNYQNVPMPAHAHEVPAISGAFMLLSRSFYERLNGLDEGYFLHMEDMDFCYRVHKAGGKVICMPEVKVIHFRSTSEAASRVVEKHKSYGFIRYLKMHFSGQHPVSFFKLMNLGIWARYWLKMVVNVIDHAFVPPLAAKHETARIVWLHRLTRFGAHDNSLAGKTILVAGGSGQVGIYVTGLALARGAHVIATYNKTHVAFEHPQLTWLRKDFNHVTFEGIKADALVYTPPLWTLPTRLNSLSSTGIRRIVAFSSAPWFGRDNFPKNNYDQDLLEKYTTAEEAILTAAAEQKLDVTLLCPTIMYGAGLDNNITRQADVVRRFGFLAIYPPSKGLRHPLQVSDVARTVLDILYNPATYSKSYMLGGSQVVTYLEMLEALFDYMGKKRNIKLSPRMPWLLDWVGTLFDGGRSSKETALRMNQDLVFDTQGATDDFGFRPKAYLAGDVVI